ncbi:MAG: FmdB family zinc ribbon protein [Candidatus Geothermincolia bacterium]
MPVYEYRCRDCEHQFDFFARSMSAEAESCPACGGSRLKKLLSVFGFKSSGGKSSGGGSSCSSCSSHSCSSCGH